VYNRVVENLIKTNRSIDQAIKKKKSQKKGASHKDVIKHVAHLSAFYHTGKKSVLKYSTEAQQRKHKVRKQEPFQTNINADRNKKE